MWGGRLRLRRVPRPARLWGRLAACAGLPVPRFPPTSQDGVFRFRYSPMLVCRAAPLTGTGDICSDDVEKSRVQGSSDWDVESLRNAKIHGVTFRSFTPVRMGLRPTNSDENQVEGGQSCPQPAFGRPPGSTTYGDFRPSEWSANHGRNQFFLPGIARFEERESGSVRSRYQEALPARLERRTGPPQPNRPLVPLLALTYPNVSQPNAPRVAPRESGGSTAGSQGCSLSTMRLANVAPRSYETAMAKSTNCSPPGVFGPYS